MKIEHYDLPAHWASYLINDDCSGMDDADIAAVDGWFASTFGECASAWCVDADLDNTGFTRWHDASEFALACDACKFTFHVQ